MKIKILLGEYMWSEQGLHVLDESGFAKIATEETEVEVTDETQLAIIQAYQEAARPQPPVVEEVAEVEGETTNG
jgi:hypothetical protein